MSAKRWRRNHPEAFRFRKLNRRQKQAKKEVRSKNQNRHHLTNKCRGGDFSPENIVMLKVWKHNQWHSVFKNSDPEYIIAVLQRLCRMKGRTSVSSETPTSQVNTTEGTISVAPPNKASREAA